MAWHVFRLSLILLIAGIVSAGCSRQTERSTVSSKKAVKNLDHEVVMFQQGTPIETVRTALGKPESEFIQGTEASLYYGLWQLIFDEGELTRRIRIHEQKHRPLLPFDKASERKSRALDHKVLELHHGMPISVVKLKLGAPDTYEEVLESVPIRETILRYESWELTFIYGRLRSRTKF